MKAFREKERERERNDSQKERKKDITPKRVKGSFLLK